MGPTSQKGIHVGYAGAGFISLQGSTPLLTNILSLNTHLQHFHFAVFSPKGYSEYSELRLSSRVFTFERNADNSVMSECDMQIHIHTHLQYVFMVTEILLL